MYRETICLWQTALGAQSEQVPERVSVWGAEVDMPALLLHICHAVI